MLTNKKPIVENFANDSIFSDDTFTYSIIPDTNTVRVISLSKLPEGPDQHLPTLNTEIPSSVKHPISAKEYSVVAIGDGTNPVFVYKSSTKDIFVYIKGIDISSLEDENPNFTFTIPSSVKRIESNSFKKCNINYIDGCSLTFTPDSQLEFIGSHAFKECYGEQEKLIIPKSVKTIDRFAFQSSYISSQLEFETGIQLETISERAFASSWFYGNVTIPKSVKVIEPYAFENFTMLSSKFTKKLKQSGLGELFFEPGSLLTTIAEGAFSNIPFNNVNLYIPLGVTTINTDAFRNSHLCAS